MAFGLKKAKFDLLYFRYIRSETYFHMLILPNYRLDWFFYEIVLGLILIYYFTKIIKKVILNRNLIGVSCECKNQVNENGSKKETLL